MKKQIHALLLAAFLGVYGGLANADDVNDVNNVNDPSLTWFEDIFDANQIDPAGWRVTKIDHLSNKGTIGVDGHSHLVVTATNSQYGQPEAQIFVETINRRGNMAWTYYSAMNFAATAVNREDLRLGFRFEMTDGSAAYLVFDSKDGMQVKYGNGMKENKGPVLYQNSWYELKFAWDGAELRAWYREQGRSQWLGGLKGEGLALYSSFTAYPERLRIGQPETKYPGSVFGVTMTLMVDYWLEEQERPAPEMVTKDDFKYTDLDPAKWRILDNAFSSNAGNVDPDDRGHLVVTATNGQYGQPEAQVFAETINRLGNVAWTHYSAVNFAATAVNREDLRLGFWFEVTDGSAAYLVFDSKDGMQLKYGNDKQTHEGPSLYRNWWYELKFTWDGVELRAWYREQGRSQWLGGSKGEGLALYSSFTAYPERLRIGQPESKYPASVFGVTMTLMVDCWLAEPEAPAPEKATEDDFKYTDLDPAKWRILDNEVSSNTGNVDPDNSGHLVVTATNGQYGQPEAQVFAETIGRLGNAAWTYYSAIHFVATAVNREDLRLGFWFEVTDGRVAYLVFDSRDGMQLKYGNDKQESKGPVLYPNSWYELKFAWDGAELRAWYREQGRSQWLGGQQSSGLLLFTAPTSHPERLRIGQPETRYPGSVFGVTMTLTVDYWRMQPG